MTAKATSKNRHAAFLFYPTLNHNPALPRFEFKMPCLKPSQSGSIFFLPPFFYDPFVQPLIDNKHVIDMGFCNDKQYMYDQINCVFHSSKSECASYVEYECRLTGTDIETLDSAKSDGKMWDNDRIFNAWMNLLEIDHAL